MAAILGDEVGAREAYDEALETARASGQKDWIWRALDARAQLEQAAGAPVRARRDREAALAVLEEIAERLPRDLREVFWNDPRRKAARAASLRDLVSAATSPSISPVGEDRLARVLEINRAIAGEHDLARLLEKVTDHAIALLRAERGFVLLKSGYASGGQREERASDLSVHASRDEGGDDPHGRFSQSIADRVMSAGEPVLTASARDDARMAGYVSVHQLMLESIACVPIRSRTRGIIGALYLETRLRPAASFADELPTLTALADQVAIAIETARLLGENARRAADLEQANRELTVAQAKLTELLGDRTVELEATRRDLSSTRAVLHGHFGYEGLIGRSDAMRRVFAPFVDRVKDADVAVLSSSARSGTGKEVIARAIHNAGARAEEALRRLGLNCGAGSPSTSWRASLLRPHVRGALHGRRPRSCKGLFREATGGTILLDEIGEMPKKMHSGPAFRVLQEKVVRPVGSGHEEAGGHPRHRRDPPRSRRARRRGPVPGRPLLPAPRHVEVNVPPLRERLEDIPWGSLIDPLPRHLFAARFYSRDRRKRLARGARSGSGVFPWPAAQRAAARRTCCCSTPVSALGRAGAFHRGLRAALGPRAPAARLLLRRRARARAQGGDLARRAQGVRARADARRALEVQLEPAEGGAHRGAAAAHLLPPAEGVRDPVSDKPNPGRAGRRRAPRRGRGARSVEGTSSAHMDEHEGDMAGFAKKKGWQSVAPEYRKGQAVLVVKTGRPVEAKPPKKRR